MLNYNTYKLQSFVALQGVTLDRIRGLVRAVRQNASQSVAVDQRHCGEEGGGKSGFDLSRLGVFRGRKKVEQEPSESLTFVERVSRVLPLHVHSVVLPPGGPGPLAGSSLRYVGYIARQQRRLICGRCTRGSAAYLQITDSNFSLSVLTEKTKSVTVTESAEM